VLQLHVTRVTQRAENLDLDNNILNSTLVNRPIMMVGHHQSNGTSPPVKQDVSKGTRFLNEEDIILFTEDYTDGLINAVPDESEAYSNDIIFEDSSDDLEFTDNYVFEDATSDTASSDNFIFDNYSSEGEADSMFKKQDQGDLIAFTDDYIFDDPSPQTTTLSVSRTGIVTYSDGTQSIPASLRSDRSVRKELQVKPGYFPPEDVEPYQAPSPISSSVSVSESNQTLKATNASLKKRKPLCRSSLASGNPPSGLPDSYQRSQYSTSGSAVCTEIDQLPAVSPLDSANSTSAISGSEESPSTTACRSLWVPSLLKSQSTLKSNPLLFSRYAPLVPSNTHVPTRSRSVLATQQPTDLMTSNGSLYELWMKSYPSAPPALTDGSQPKRQLHVLKSMSQDYFDPQVHTKNVEDHIYCTISVYTKHFGKTVAEGDGKTYVSQS
jgi:hypothetical protein